jgi:serine/threonine protein kinase
MGSVYLAEHRLMDRSVALKVIRPDLLGNEKLVERFRREVKAAARLALHPNIVAAYDAEQAGDSHFLVMEFIDGVDLAQLVKSQGPLPYKLVCDAVKQAAEGLDHAYQRGMVHRDIKPHNLMRTPDGQVKILDFGLARFASEALPDLVPAAEPETEAAERNHGARLTLTNMLLGTADYIAPEQARAASSADIRADIYSLGCTLYHLLAGYPPFPGGDPFEKIKAHSLQTPRPLAAVRLDLPPELLGIIDRMIVKDPSQRFQKPSEVVEALAPFADFEEIPESTTNVGEAGESEEGEAGESGEMEIAASPSFDELSRGQPQLKSSGGPSVRRRPNMVVVSILFLLIASTATCATILWLIDPEHWLDATYYWTFAEISTHLGFVLALVFLAFIVRRRRIRGSRLSWLLVILFLPYLGVPLYLMVGHRKMRRKARRLVILVLPYVGVPLHSLLGERKMRRLSRWRDRINQSTTATRQRS